MGRYSYKAALGILKGYAISEGFKKISFDGSYSYIKWNLHDLYKPDVLCIEVGKVEDQVYLMLHELGHHELRKNWVRFEECLPVIAYAEEVKLNERETKYTRRDSYIVGSLEEEFMAWSEGLRLGSLMGIRINMQHWIELKSRCLKAYIVYYANLAK